MSKNLANCKPSEFLSQTNKMRKAVKNWIDVTGIMDIRKSTPVLKQYPSDATQDQIDEINAENKKIMSEQATKNFNAILDSVLDEHPQETLEVLALICFIEPDDVDNHSIAFYLSNIAEVLNDKDVISFFTSLVRLDQSGILNV